MKLANTLALSLLLVSTGALAEDGSWYLLGEVSHSSDKLSTGTSDSALTAAGATGLSSSSSNHHGNQWRLQLGYQFNPNFALEAGYIDFGKANYSATYAQGTAEGTVKAGGVDLAALGILPLTDNFSVFGKVGVVAAHVKSSISATGVTGPGDTSANVAAPLFGAGLIYKVNDAVDLRAEYDHASNLGKSGKTDKLRSNMVSVGVAYHF